MNDWWMIAVTLSFAAATWCLLVLAERLQGARDERN